MAANTFDTSILGSQSKPNRFMSPSSIDLSSLVKMTFNLPVKLNNSNYTHWKVQVLHTIRALELEDLISSNKEPPNQFMIIQSSDNLVIESQINEAYLASKRSDQLLLSWFYVTSMESILQLIHHLQTSKKGSSYVSDFVMKIKGIGDEPKTAGQVVTRLI
ncbi:hypothetical protein ACOSQ2_016379 [Xanthoceras sorbifolium]